MPVLKHSLWSHLDTLNNVSNFIFSEMDRAMGGGFEREFGRNEMGMSRSFGETLERGIGKYRTLSTSTCFSYLNSR